MSAAFIRRHRKRKLKSEINVVPYIDVMLVLLIIFMVTAPLLNLGVDIDLPKSNAKSVETKKDPIVVSVDAEGGYTLKLQDAGRERVDAAQLAAKVGAVVKANPDIAVFVAGDGKASYDTVYQAMVLLQTAGVQKVGLMSKPTETR
ncbi:protein TolR [Arenimonas sp.]|uniref:protein TolR n=1 Tax=Arenimonas sp. TaxID=1872635 RepID=UPI0039E2D4CC